MTLREKIARRLAICGDPEQQHYDEADDIIRLMIEDVAERLRNILIPEDGD
jgi:hypothetical protein